MLARRTGIRVLWIVGIALSFVQAFGQDRAIDTSNSKLVIHISKAGAFSALGDDHQVEAPISEGLVDEETRRVTFFIESLRLKVIDPQLSADKRQQVQDRMVGPDVLNVAAFPRIAFESTGVEQVSSDRLAVHGRLTLHGVTRPVVVNVRSENGRYVGVPPSSRKSLESRPLASPEAL